MSAPTDIAAPLSEKEDHASQRTQTGQPTADATSTTQLASSQLRLKQALRQFPDFPTKGILFVDILPIFRDPAAFADLIAALENFITAGKGLPDWANAGAQVGRGICSCPEAWQATRSYCYCVLSEGVWG